MHFSTAGSDYTEKNIIKKFNETINTECMDVNITDDDEAELLQEFFTLSLSSADSAVSISIPSSLVTIINNDCKLCLCSTYVRIYTCFYSHVYTYTVTILTLLPGNIW